MKTAESSSSNKFSVDVTDALVVIGMALLGYPAFEWWGWPGLSGMVGALVIMLALVRAVR